MGVAYMGRVVWVGVGEGGGSKQKEAVSTGIVCLACLVLSVLFL